MTTLSIITINLNNKEGLLKTFNSVFNQTFTDFEYIVIDGKSTDGSVDIIKKNSDKLSHWISQKDKGIYDAMNKGISLAKGNYLCFMNSGDTFFDNHTLEFVFSELLTGDIIYGDCLRDFGDHRELWEAPRIITPFRLLKQNICHQAMFIKHTCFYLKKYDENFHALADWDLWLTLLTQGCNFQYIPYTICRYDAKYGISSNNLKLVTKETHDLTNKHKNIYPKFEKNNNIYNNLITILEQIENAKGGMPRILLFIIERITTIMNRLYKLVN